MNDATPPPTQQPAAVSAAIAFVGLFALGFAGLAVQGRDDWSDVSTFAGLSLMATHVAWSLATRERWASTVCCWVAVLSAAPLGLLGAVIGVWIAAEAAGFGPGKLIVTPVTVLIYAVWMLLLVILPVTVAYKLTRPAARDWFAAGTAD